MLLEAVLINRNNIFMKAIKIIAVAFLILSLGTLSAQNDNSVKELIKVQDIIDTAYTNSRVVMMNEAHSGQKRNIRTRIMGQLVLPKAHKHGVRVLAMEALTEPFAKEANATRKLPEAPNKLAYLHHPEMRNLMQAALDLGWDLAAYEANIKERPKMDNPVDQSNWREKQQAENLANVLKQLDKDAKILVWCGNSHHSKEPGVIPGGDFYPMGYQFWQITGIEPFVIDQIKTVDFMGDNSRYQQWAVYEKQLKRNFYGTMGFVDKATKTAIIISTDNALE